MERITLEAVVCPPPNVRCPNLMEGSNYYALTLVFSRNPSRLLIWILSLLHPHHYANLSFISLYTEHKLFSKLPSTDESLATLWENLSLTERENTTINIDSKTLLFPSNALIGRLAMKKHVIAFELEKWLRIMWEVPAALKVTLLNEICSCSSLPTEKLVI